MIDPNSDVPRRGFLGTVAAAAVGLTAASALAERASAATPPAVADPKLEAWFEKLKAGKHHAVFDAPAPNDGMPAVWPRVYLSTMEATYPGESGAAMVILRQALALNDAVWAKYHIGEMFEIKSGTVAATKNPYAVITDIPLPNIGVSKLLATGVLIGACDVALTVYSGMAAGKMKMDAAAVKKEWVAGLMPGVQVVPSGVMAVARAQEFGANYIFAG
jgi:intracellular sulfur oxidation DsrE/DsrF family protein